MQQKHTLGGERGSMSEQLARVADRYKDRAMIRALVQLIPFGIGSAIDTAVTAKLAVYQEERLRAFFDELARGNVKLTPELVQTEDFLHAFSATTKAALATRRRDKIRLLARLLRGAFEDQPPETIDEYEEFLAILDELSSRELSILALLAKHERITTFAQMDNDLQRANKVWPAFELDVATSVGLSPEQLAPVLVRLQRSGCYVEISGSYWDYPGGRGRLTQLFWRIDEVVGGLTAMAT